MKTLFLRPSLGYQMRGRMNSRRAYTLIELLIVIGIILVLLSLSVGAFALMFSRRGLRGAVDVVQGAMVKMRERSTTTGQPVFLVVEHWRNPVKLRGWQATFDSLSGTWSYLTVDDPIELPEGVFMYTTNWSPTSPNWWREDVNVYAPFVAGMPYFRELNAICTDTAPEAPGYDFTNTTAGPSEDDKRHEGHAYILVFHPTGAVTIAGRPDISPWAMDADLTAGEIPNGDLVLTNSVQAVYIDVNATTGRMRWTAYEGLPDSPP